MPFKGVLADTLFQLVGGLRAAMGYCGVETIQQLQTDTQFLKITSASLIENHPHGISLVKEAPNYSRRDY